MSLRNRVLTAGALAVAVTIGGALVFNVPSMLSQRMAIGAVVEDLVDGTLDHEVWMPSGLPDDRRAPTASLAHVLGHQPEITYSQLSAQHVLGSAKLTWTWDLNRHSDLSSSAGRGGQDWTYETTIKLVRSGMRWRAEYSPATVHPELEEGDALAAERIASARGRILGQDAAVLTEDGAVVDIGIRPDRVDDRQELVTKLRGILDLKLEDLDSSLNSAADDAFVKVVTLRWDEYKNLESSLRPLPGVVFMERTQSLSRSPGFASAVLGRVGQATAEDIEADQQINPADEVGRSGLQRAFDSQLRGTPGIRVVKKSGADGGRSELREVQGSPGTDVETSLDPRIQSAADRAVGRAEKPAAIAVVRPSDGHILAAANADPEGPSYDRALTGQYPPGSVFKIASAYAMLEQGDAQTTSHPCPKTTVVNGKRFKNAEDAAHGDVTLLEDFAQSCNTAFVDAAGEYTSAELSAAARTLGIRETTIGIDSYIGDAPETDDAVEHAAASIGQGRILASPLGVATMTASVAAGETVTPVLVPAAAETPSARASLAPDSTAALREMMRRTVTHGTAHELSNVPGDPVYGKTGTAEYGTDVPPRTHSWFSGYQGDMGLFRVECGHADRARVLEIDVEVPDDEWTSTPADLKDLDNAPSYVSLRCCCGSLCQV
ncbi:penicillin-binding transpeptidase domain-containing protein [Brevibacterium otitidis]|uniref:Penicillin-binding transpeptidase domain-containing protein n=1 Tax=Brevibacterium otitidis TaxID=53364 RepID=A0ABV5X387_9MICO